MHIIMWQTVGNKSTAQMYTTPSYTPMSMITLQMQSLDCIKVVPPEEWLWEPHNPESCSEEGSVGWCWIHVSPPLHCPLFLFLSFPSLSLSSSSPSFRPHLLFCFYLSTSHLLLKRVHTIVCTLFGHRSLSLVGLQQGSASTSQLLFLDTIHSLKKH